MNGVEEMGKRYLMRLGKTPFEPNDGFDTLDRNTIGRNNGNLIFGNAAHKLFSTADAIVDANRYKINKSMAAKVNDEYDGFILAFGKCFPSGIRGRAHPYNRIHRKSQDSIPHALRRCAIASGWQSSKFEED